MSIKNPAKEQQVVYTAAPAAAPVVHHAPATVAAPGPCHHLPQRRKPKQMPVTNPNTKRSRGINDLVGFTVPRLLTNQTLPNVGDEIKEGQVICIIEKRWRSFLMKLKAI